MDNADHEPPHIKEAAMQQHHPPPPPQRFRTRTTLSAIAAIPVVAGLLIVASFAATGQAKTTAEKVVEVDLVQAGDAIFIGGGGSAPAGAPKPGPFYSHGALYPAGTLSRGELKSGVKPIGTWQSFGWLSPQSSVQFGSYYLNRRGSFETQGGSDPSGASAIVGGTGTLRRASGEATAVPLQDNSSPVAFRETFTFRTR
jgi:hypothetical protein